MQVQSSTGRWYTRQPMPVQILNRIRLLLAKPQPRTYGAYLSEEPRVNPAKRVTAAARYNVRRAAHPRDVELHAPLRRRRA